MRSSGITLKELKLIPIDEGVVLYPADGYLIERAGQRLKLFQTSQVDKEKSVKELDKVNSPVCYA
tara:strand:+ start:799 stop:993 length:195 start_codon:yes stop_codon:yes gene_type:complete